MRRGCCEWAIIAMMEREGRSKNEEDIVVIASDLTTAERGRTERGGGFGILESGVDFLRFVVDEWSEGACDVLYEAETFWAERSDFLEDCDEILRKEFAALFLLPWSKMVVGLRDPAMIKMCYVDCFLSQNVS